MKLTITAASRGKDRSCDYNEDSFRIESTSRHAFAVVSDGVGSLTYASEFSKFLAGQASEEWLFELIDWQSVLEGFGERIGRHPNAIVRQRQRREGSAATLAIAKLEIVGRRKVSGRVGAFGDSIIVVSTPTGYSTFPEVRSSDFTTSTDAISTVRGGPETLPTLDWSSAAPCALAISTDGVAHWLLEQAERRGNQWLYQWLQAFSEAMLPAVNDDATLIVVRVTRRWTSRLAQLLSAMIEAFLATGGSKIVSEQFTQPDS